MKARDRQRQTLTKVVVDAIARSLSVEGDLQDQAVDLELDMAWFRKHRTSLLRRHADEYVAIIDASIVDHARDFEALAARVFARYGNRNIYMPGVEATEQTARMRSPRKACRRSLVSRASPARRSRRKRRRAD